MQARFLICEITQVECANNSDTANTAKWSVTSKPVVRQYVPGQHTIILEGVQVNEVSMKTGIPMHIPEPDNDYTSYKEARLYFGGPHSKLPLIRGKVRTTLQNVHAH